MTGPRRVRCRRRGRQRSGPAVRRAPAAVPELPRRARRDGPAAGRSGDQPAVDRGHHRRVRVRAYRTAGDVVTQPRSQSTPSPTGPRPARRGRSSSEAFRDFQQIGFTAVKADVPDGMTAAGVRRLDRRLRPGPVAQPVQLAVRRDGRHGRGDRTGQAVRRHAGRARPGPYDDLLDGASRPGWPNRRSAPTSTRAGSPAPSTIAARCAGSCRPKGCARCTTPTSAASSRPRREIVRLLDDLGPDVIGLGPDTGHLRWAGVEPAAFIRRYADRIGGIHIKDCFPDFLDSGKPVRHELPRDVRRRSGCGPSPASASSTSRRCSPPSRPATTATS